MRPYTHNNYRWLVSNGGYRETAGLINFTLLKNNQILNRLVNTNETYVVIKHFFAIDELEKVKRLQRRQLEKLANITSNPKQQALIEQYKQAYNAKDQISSLNQHLDAKKFSPYPYQDTNNPLISQIQNTLASCAAGLTLSADLIVDGFDTHAYHDNNYHKPHNHLLHGIDYLWQEANRLQIADRIRLFVSSDFSRTPFYNTGQGKDNWPINSAILMQQRPQWQQSVGVRCRLKRKKT